MVLKPNEIYQRNQVTTARPEELTLMLYNGGIKFLQQARVAIDKKDIPKAHSLITRVQDIVTELMVTLNMDYEISKTLLPLYEYMKNRLVEANVAKDSEILSEIEEMFQELRTTWAQAIKQSKSM
ncbi:flagellar export chaperone FliS [Bacillus sp. FJAT-27445]|uniref:flagellar export chaperone FliS n=1 Tax=Bacillus sp. FJAT-27445 TaxID=1679166 RepID=UPI0007438B12|nr:flagellar export chaperone FliS [Bacillus sp. FJAT-27445]